MKTWLTRQIKDPPRAIPNPVMTTSEKMETDIPAQKPTNVEPEGERPGKRIWMKTTLEDVPMRSESGVKRAATTDPG